jgi:hypothetical protein
MKKLYIAAGVLCAATLGSLAWMAAARSSDDPQANIAAAEQRLQTLVQRTQRLQDEREIENLQRIYSYYLDRALWDQLADLFTDDGTIEIAMRGVYVGKKRIRESLELFGPQYLTDGRLMDHANLQPVITVAADGATAKGRVRALIMNGTYGKSGTIGDGIYENSYVKQEGVWKIHALKFYTTFFSDYDKGWATSAFPAPAASETLPPDRPPTVVYENYPTYFVPPFHYPNPVTGKPVQYRPGTTVTQP